uniref:Ribosomal protein n=1 Tax=Piridium sociabile TaxID=2570542 RepID=A0A5B9XWD7_9ALVE|nr:ribosomal protein L36 [Piridium sociabile]
MKIKSSIKLRCNKCKIVKRGKYRRVVCLKAKHNQCQK